MEEGRERVAKAKWKGRKRVRRSASYEQERVFIKAIEYTCVRIVSLSVCVCPHEVPPGRSLYIYLPSAHLPTSLPLPLPLRLRHGLQTTMQRSTKLPMRGERDTAGDSMHGPSRHFDDAPCSIFYSNSHRRCVMTGIAVSVCKAGSARIP